MINTIAIFFIFVATIAHAAVTRVGNGNDGRDLEGFDKIESGMIVETRQQAVETLKKLNVQGIRGLGQLLPELEKTTLYMAKQNVQATSEAERQSRFEADMMGRVYARTFPEPLAATRFFPISSTLDKEQLVALHIHEALHRALPLSVRENEDVVGQLTLAMTSPEASYDRVAAAAGRAIPVEFAQTQTFDEGKSSTKVVVPEDASIKRPSVFRYTYRSFEKDQQSRALTVYESLHSVESFLFPFGTDENPIGIGVGLSFANGREGSELGPLSLSARGRLWSARSFDVGWWGEGQLATVSSDEVKNSAYGRDSISAGLSARRDSRHFYLENILGITFSSSAKQKIKETSYEYIYKYGNIYNAKVRAGGKIGGFALGGFALGGFGELLLSEGRTISGPNFSEESGRFNILSAGPELSFTAGSITATVFGRFILGRSKEANYDYIGNVFGIGAGDGQIGASLAISL